MEFETTAARSPFGKGRALLRDPSAKFCALAFLCAAAALLAFPTAVQDSVRKSILYCLTVLTPSLFPFMALTGFAVNSGAGETLGGCLGFLSRYVFRLPDVCTAPILMSFIGGYPAGARGASLLLEQGKITEAQAGRMMLFCVNPGAAFVVTFLGGTVLHSFRAGWLLFFAVTLSGILLGILSGLRTPVPERGIAASPKVPGGALMRSVTDASSSVLKMCACIVLFSGFTALLHGAGAYQFLSRALASLGIFTPIESAVVLSFLIEVTGGTGVAAAFRAGPTFYAFGLAFGGLCVHLQVFSFFKGFPAPKWKFFLFRFLHGFLAAGCYPLLTRLIPGDPVETLAAAEAVQGVSALSGTLAGGLSLLLMCMAFLLIATKKYETPDGIAPEAGT